MTEDHLLFKEPKEPSDQWEYFIIEAYDKAGYYYYLGRMMNRNYSILQSCESSHWLDNQILGPPNFPIIGASPVVGTVGLRLLIETLKTISPLRELTPYRVVTKQYFEDLVQWRKDLEQWYKLAELEQYR